MSDRPLLMIPGPIEISPLVCDAASRPPRSHTAQDFIEDFGRSIERMRDLWLAGPESQPFVLAGSGTLAMEMAATNVCQPGDRALVVHTGYFSARMAEMLRRRGVEVEKVMAQPGDAPANEAIDQALSRAPTKALFATHVDTSTGVRVDAKALCELAQNHGALSIFDGVCATGAERFCMEEWGADIYLTASQKALGLPVGLALLVASPAALRARADLQTAPSMSVDFHEWLPIMRAYEERRPSYFATPATTLVTALCVGLEELLEPLGAEALFGKHQRCADAMRAAFEALNLSPLPLREDLRANTLSALYYPEGVDAALCGAVAARGVSVAGGLYPSLKTQYFRVGHMGWVTGQDSLLRQSISAIAESLVEHGHPCDPAAALSAFEASYGK